MACTRVFGACPIIKIFAEGLALSTGLGPRGRSEQWEHALISDNKSTSGISVGAVIRALFTLNPIGIQ